MCALDTTGNKGCVRQGWLVTHPEGSLAGLGAWMGHWIKKGVKGEFLCFGLSSRKAGVIMYDMGSFVSGDNLGPWR